MNSKFPFFLLFAIFALMLVPRIGGLLAQSSEILNPEVTVSTVANLPFVNPDGEIQYTTTITNNGETPITGLTIDQNWPEALLDQGVVAGITSWNVDILPAKQSVQRVFSLKVRSDVLAQTYQGSTALTIASPSWHQEAFYTLDVRAVRVLSSQLPDTSVPDKVYVLGFFIIVQMSLVATWALRSVLIKHRDEE